MLKIFVDTCVWRHWLSWVAGRISDLSPHYADATAFDDVLTAIKRGHVQAQLLYDERVMLELGEALATEARRRTEGHSTRIPIPGTRADGSFKADGSFLYGGVYSGSLDVLLTADGMDHERLVHEAAVRAQTAGTFLYDEKIRRKEFDVEHLEASLEAQADYFVTSDVRTIILRLQRLSERLPNDQALQAVTRTLRRPTQLRGELVSAGTGFQSF
ncbi:MAG TPA: hypothetical protein DCW96_10245 [Stenotrophomonas sp.]|nr:hypothetical protein [Stenotrophomonas sp.]